MTAESNRTLLAVVGPTAIGKTALAISLAQMFSAEIISADSRQFYREMSIGTAVPSKEELESAPHHLIQHISILNKYTVGNFEKEALSLLKTLFTKNEVAVMVGGSGLYIDAVTKGLDIFPEISPEVRMQLNKTFMLKGIKPLQEQLKHFDPAYYEVVDKANPHRLIRALEVCLGSGQPYSSFLNQKRVPRPFKVVTIGINDDRDKLYRRIEDRVDKMRELGILDEAKALYRFKNLNALQTVGYQELFRHLDGEWDLEHAYDEIKKNTRRFAKRQLTWFRKNKDIHWVKPDPDLEELKRELNLLSAK